MSLAASEMGDRWDRTSLARWICCLMLVLVVHAGLALAILLRKPAVELGTPVPAAVMMDLAPLPSPPTPLPRAQPAAPQVQPPAPPSQAAQLKPAQPSTTAPKRTQPAAPAPSVSPAPPKPTNLTPQASPHQTATRRIITVPPPAEPRPPATPSKPQQKPAQQRPQYTSRAASKPGTGVSNEQFLSPSALWAMQLKAHVRRYRQFTLLRGVVVLHLDVDRRGKVLSAWVEQSSGNDALDNEGLLQIYRANPLPPPPAAIRGNVIAFSMDILFLDD